ncbi:MAG TPA: PEP-CTERM sorting domain-containing protein [Pirellulales bacterium]|jgi:hypothetical protein
MRSQLVFWFFGVAVLGFVLARPAVCRADAPSEFVPADFQPNYDLGYKSGLGTGYQSGLLTGRARGNTEGAAAGHTDGYTVGYGETYQPAFDRAYDLQYPIANRSGWDVGVRDGIYAGFDWAEAAYRQWLSEQSGSITVSGNSLGAGLFVSSGAFNSTISFVNLNGTLFASDYTVWRSHFDPNYDWAGHYYGVGVTDGTAAGTTLGDTVGYNLMYPLGYAAGYKFGVVDGKVGGVQEGTTAGGRQGNDDGWSAGNSSGYSVGFDAGMWYFETGNLVEPKYALAYAARSVNSSQGVPEPASIVLLAIAGGFGLLRRKR